MATMNFLGMVGRSDIEVKNDTVWRTRQWEISVLLIDSQVIVVFCGKTCDVLSRYLVIPVSISICLQETVIKSLRKYGVGSCGPRGFYGTVGEQPLFNHVSVLIVCHVHRKNPDNILFAKFSQAHL